MNKLFILLLLFSCAPKAPHVFQPTGFSVAQQSAIENAANEWCDKSNGKYCPAIVLTAIDNLDYSKVEYTNSLDHGGKYDIGMTTTYPNGLYRVQIKECPPAPENWCTEHIRRVALHEFGHTFGKPEDTEQENVMYPDISYQSEHLTERDVQ